MYLPTDERHNRSREYFYDAIAAALGGRAAEEIGVLMDGFNRMAESLERQRFDLERRRRYIETILENATTGVVAVDSRGAIRTLNPASRELLGLDELRLEGDLGLLDRDPALSDRLG